LRRRWARRHGKRMTQSDLAGLVGVHRGTVAAWESDAQEPRGENLIGLAEVLETTPQFIVSGSGADTEAEPAAREIEGLLSSLDEVMRTLQKIDPEPGSQTARKKDALRLMRELWATLGESIPEWFWDIQERVERGEL